MNGCDEEDEDQHVLRLKFLFEMQEFDAFFDILDPDDQIKDFLPGLPGWCLKQYKEDVASCVDAVNVLEFTQDEEIISSLIQHCDSAAKCRDLIRCLTGLKKGGCCCFVVGTCFVLFSPPPFRFFWVHCASCLTMAFAICFDQFGCSFLFTCF